MPANPISSVDPDGLLEFSVVFTDRSLNHMSAAFQVVMRDISATLKKVYGAHAVAIVPGGGTYGMESVARQLATGKRVTVIRNGFFSYRWTQIFEMGAIPTAAAVLQARRTSRPRPASCYLMTICAAWRRPCTPSAACSCSIALRPARCG